MLFRTVRSRLTLAMATLALGSLAGVFVGVDFVIGRFTEAALHDDVVASRRAFQKFYDERHALLKNRALMLADAPYLKALMEYDELDWDTCSAMAKTLTAATPGERALIFDDDGRLVGDSAGDLESASAWGTWAAIDADDRPRVLRAHGSLFHAALAPIATGERLLGYLASARSIDAAFVDEVITLTGGLALLTDGSGLRFSSERALAIGQRDVDALLSEAGHEGRGVAIPFDVSLGGERYQGSRVPIEGHADLWILKPLTQVTALFNDIRSAVLFAGAIVALITLAVSRTIARRLSVPIRKLIDASRAFGGGDLTARVSAPGDDELGELGRSYNEMAERLESLVDDISTKNREIEAARDAAEIASRAKSDFLARISHELRTPLTGVLGMSELLAETSLDTAQQSYNSTVALCARSLHSMISDVLDFSMIDSGELDVIDEPFALREVLASATASACAAAEARGFAFDIVVDPTMPEHIRGDGPHLSRAVLQLVDNAVKFTDQGHVEVNVARVAAAGEFRIRVRDTGVGIPENAIAQIFDAFQQVDGSRSRAFEGAGIGLALCRLIVDGLGGTLGVESRVGQGSEFSITLPLRAAVSAPEPPSPSPSAESDATEGDADAPDPRRFALVVDDNPVNLRILTKFVARLGYECIQASDGQDAVDKFDPVTQRFVLTDLRMPRMDGIDAARRMRELEPSGVRIPIIAVTADVAPGKEDECRAAGIDAFLAKPISLAAVRDVVEALVNSSAG